MKFLTTLAVAFGVLATSTPAEAGVCGHKLFKHRLVTKVKVRTSGCATACGEVVVAQPPVKVVPPVVVVKSAMVVQPSEVQVEATAKTTGPVFNAVLRAKVRQELRAKHGYSLAESIRKANELTDENIKGLIADAETLSGVKVVGTAIGDGKIIGAIIDFFNSPMGKMLLEMLMKLLLGLAVI